jgi:CHASE3 domain sensor protein
MKKKRSFAVKLSLRFMFILTIAVLLLSLSFLYFLRSLVNANQTEELRSNQERVFQALEDMDYSQQINEGEESVGRQLLINDFPYYLTYIA